MPSNTHVYLTPTFKLEDIKGGETFVFKSVTFNSVLEEIEFSLLSSMNLY